MDVLKKYINQVRGVSYKPSDVCDNEKGVPILRAGNICDNRICLDDIVCIDSSKIRPEQFLRDGDVLICASSGSKSVVGKAAIYKLNNFISAFGAFCKVVRIKDDENVLADFIRLYFSSKFYREQISNKSQGANINNIKTDDIDSLLINIPDIQTQNIAVSELDNIQSALDTKKEQLKKLDELIQSKFYEMFGDPVVNDKGWEIKTIDNIGRVITGNTPSRSVEGYYDAKFIEWVKTDNIIKGKMYPSEAKEYLSEEGMKRGRVVDVDSILVTCIAGSISSIGGCCLTNRKVAFNQQINAVVPNKDVNSKFVYYYIMLSKELIRNKASQGMKHIISKSSFEELPIILPPLPLQQAFAAYVEKVEQAKAIVNQEIAHLQELLDSRMDYYFHTKTEM